MNNANRVFIIKKIAELCHKGQVDKAGRPYFEHVSRVGDAGITTSEQIVGYLHDACEDGHITHAELERLGLLTDQELNALKLLDKNHELTGSRYDDDSYYVRIKGHGLARAVKINDLADNLDLTRFTKAGIQVSDRIREKHEEYKKRMKQLYF